MKRQVKFENIQRNDMENIGKTQRKHTENIENRQSKD